MIKKIIRPLIFFVTILYLFIPTLTPASAISVYEPDIPKMSSWQNPKISEFYSIGITGYEDYLYYDDWVVKINGSSSGKMMMMRPKSDAAQGLTFAHPNQVRDWATYFNGNPDYVVNFFSTNQTDIKQTVSNRVIKRPYSRDLARRSGANITVSPGSFDSNGYRAGIVQVTTTKFPDASLTASTIIEKGQPLSIKVTGEEFNPHEEELTWTLYADSTRLDGGVVNSNTLSKNVSRSFSACGVKELKLTVTDEVQRSTVKTMKVNVTGCETPPPLGQPALTIEPSTQEVMVGDTASFTANYFDASGNKTVVTTHSGATWSAVNSLVAQPGTKGQFIGNSVGTSEVNVTYSGLMAKATVIVSATSPEPEPEPEPIPNLDPEVEIQGPIVVRAGEEFCLHASASDPDGEITTYSWDYNGFGGLWAQTGCGLYYMKEGEKTVQVTVTDDAGGTASDTHTILVVPPAPIADFKQEGALKENRKWTVTDTTSTPVKFPIVEEKWTIEAVDPANNVPEIMKYKGSLTEDKAIDLLMKKEGKYKVTRFVRNSYSDPDKNWNEKIVEYTVRPDAKPTADFATVTAKLREDVKERPALSQTRVSVQDDSGSNDDFIGQRVWSYQFDSNNDGKFDSNDDHPVIFSDGNEEAPYFDTNKVGKYKIGLLAIEEFAQPTIEEFVTEADRRRDDTSDKPSSESVVEVKNIRPVVSYDVKAKKDIDLQLDAIDSPYTQQMIETAFNEEIVPKLDAEGYKVNLEWLERKTGSSVLKMALGDEHTSVILENGEVWSTGYNINGQLGNGTKTASFVPIKMTLPAGRSAVSIAAGNAHTSVLLDNGEVWNVGDNFYGQLGDGTKTDRLVPIKMPLPAGRSVVSIAAGNNQTSVLLDNGEVWGTGANGSGQLGNGATSNSSVPVRMILPSGRTATMITIGVSFTSVLLDNGEVWGVGANGYGQLGNGATTNSLVLVKMTLPVDRSAVSIAAGGRFMSVLLDNGEVWNVGENNYGQIGVGSNTTIKEPTKMTLPNGRSAVMITAGPYQSNVILDNGEVWSAGYNYTGALGDGTDTSAKTAVKMTLPAGRSAMSAAGGFNRTSVTLDNGEVWSTGHNTSGQLGNGTTTNSKVPVKMTLPSRAASSTGVIKATKTTFQSSNNYLFVGLVSDKEVDSDAVSSSVKDAGGNFIGLGNVTNKTQMDSIVTANGGKGTYLPLNDNVNTMMGSVADYIVAEMNKKPDETTIDLQVGLDDTPNTKEQLETKFNEILKPKLNDERIKANIKFIEKETNSYVSSITGNGSSLIFVLEDGSAYGVGYNLYGELGVGSSAWIKKPIKINLPDKVTSVSMSRAYTLFLLEDGSVYGTGQGSYGQLGTGSADVSYVPLKMILPDKAKYIYTEPIFSNTSTRSFVVLDNGQVYSAGASSISPQGDTTPVKEQGLPDKVKMVTSSGQNTSTDKTFFLLENGEVYEKFTRYGLNELGEGVYTPHFNKIDSLPSKVLKISTSNSHTLFLLENGEVYGEGENAVGALGNGEYGYSVTCSSSCKLTYNSLIERAPVKMQGLPSRVIDIGAGPLISYMKLQNNDIYGVGNNQGNQLGDNAMGESMDVEGAYAYNNQYIQTTPVKVTGIPSEVVFMEGYGGYIQDTSGLKSFATQGNNFFLLKTGKLYSPTAIQTGYYNLTDVNAIGKLNTTENILNSNGFDFVESKNILFGSIFSRQAMDSEKLGASVLGADADFIGVGNSISKPSFDQVIQKNMQTGTFIEDAPLDIAVTKMADYIIERVNHQINTKELYVTLDDTVTYKTVYSDYENDPLFSERWKYMHTPDVFEHNMGVDPKAHKYLTLPIEQFTRVGKYQPLYSGRDNPVHWDHNAFDTYRLWAKEADNWFIYAHRKPIPDFSFTIDNITGAYSVTNKALDLDKYSIEIGNGPGIRKQTFQWRVDGEKTWKAGLPTGNLEQKVYEIKNTVVDFQRRTESMIKKMDATGINKPPVAVFEPIPSVITVGQDILFKNLSWDPNGDPLTAQWAIKKKGEPDSAYSALSTDYEPTKNFTAQGEYIVRLIVRDPSNETDSTTRDIVVMANNTKPSAGFTYSNPVYIGDTIQIESTATDPDGDYLSYTYTIEKQNGDPVTIQSGDPEMDSNGHVTLQADQFPSDLGKWTITQTVSDGQMEDTATGELTVMDQTIEGFVNHTQKWEENRQKYNFKVSGMANSPRGPEVFFPGEKFMLKADTTSTADRVDVQIVGFPEYKTTLTKNNGEWVGSIWRDDMMERFIPMDGQELTFEFTSRYLNGWIRNDTVKVRIVDDEYWRQHTTY